MSARGVTAQELPENQDESVKGVIHNQILHGHVRPAANLEEAELPEAGAAVDAFTASLEVDGGPIPEGFDHEPEEPAEPVRHIPDAELVDGQSEGQEPAAEEPAAEEPAAEDPSVAPVALEDNVTLEVQNDAAGAGE